MRTREKEFDNGFRTTYATDSCRMYYYWLWYYSSCNQRAYCSPSAFLKCLPNSHMLSHSPLKIVDGNLYLNSSLPFVCCIFSPFAFMHWENHLLQKVFCLLDSNLLTFSNRVSKENEKERLEGAREEGKTGFWLDCCSFIFGIHLQIHNNTVALLV